MIRILMVDDHQILRESLASMLERQDDFEVVGQAASGIEAIGKAQKLQPDMDIMDVAMADLNGIATTRELTDRVPGCRVLGLSAHHDRRHIRAMIRAGAKGYLPKHCALEDLAQAIRTIMDGRVYIAADTAGDLVKGMLHPSEEDLEPAAELSPRERQVLQLIAEGKTTRQIGEDLHISAKTVETHRRNIMIKLDLDNVAELTRYALQEGLTQLDL